MLGMRVVPPVRSPITVPSILAGMYAAVRPRAAQIALESVGCQLDARFAPESMLLTSSGTSALALALQYGARKPGHLVAMPAYGCYDLATAVDAAKSSFILYDIDPLTLGPNWDSLRAALAAGADRLVVVHLYGIPVDMLRVRAMAEEFGALVIEDAAQGAGGFLGRKPLGAYGSLAILSFGRGKGMTGGHGGALLANDAIGAAILDRVHSLPEGRGSLTEIAAFVAQWMMARPGVYGIPASIPFLGLGQTPYRGPEESRQPSRFAVGALSRTIGLVDDEARIRRHNAKRMEAFLFTRCMQPILAPSDAEAGYLRLPVRVFGAAAVAARQPAARKLGIMPGYPTSLASLPGFGDRQRNPRLATTGASSLERELITFPTHGGLCRSDVVALEVWCGEHGC